MFQAIVSFLSKLPIAQYIKPLWKSAAKALISNEIEQLRPQLKDAAAKGPAAVDALFAAFEKKIDDGFAALPIPAWAKALLQAAEGSLDTQLEHARLLVDAALINEGANGVDAALNSAKALLLSKIDSL